MCIRYFYFLLGIKWHVLALQLNFTKKVIKNIVILWGRSNQSYNYSGTLNYIKYNFKQIKKTRIYPFFKVIINYNVDIRKLTSTAKCAWNSLDFMLNILQNSIYLHDFCGNSCTVCKQKLAFASESRCFMRKAEVKNILHYQFLFLKIKQQKMINLLAQVTLLGTSTKCLFIELFASNVTLS